MTVASSVRVVEREHLGGRTAVHELIARRLGLILTIGAFGVYLATLSRNYTGGSIEFATEIESGNWPVLLQQHKLLSHPLGWAFIQLWNALGWHGSGLFPLQVLNALAGALAVGFVYRAALRACGSTWASALVSVGFGLSACVWLFSTEAAFLTPSLAAVALAFWALFASSRDDHLVARTLGVGVAVSAAILIYSTNVFLMPTVGLFYLLDRRYSLVQRIVRIVGFGAVVVVIMLPIYTAALVLAHGVHDLASLRSMGLYGGQGSGVVYGTVGPSNLVFGVYGFLKTLAGFPGLGLDDRTTAFISSSNLPERIAFGGYYLLALVVAVAPLVLLFRRHAELIGDRLRVVVALLCWGGLNAAFATYWVPKDLRFWGPVALSWWIVLALVLARPRSLRSVAWIPAVLLGFSVVTFVGLVLPHTDIGANRAYGFAMSVRDHTTPSDLIVTVDGENYIAYFSGRQTISLLDAVLRAGPANKAAVLAGIDEEIRVARLDGRRVYLTGADPERNIDWELLSQAGLTRADVEHFNTQPAWSVDGDNVLEIQP